MKLAPSKSAAPAHILDAQTTAVISLDSALRVVFINSTAESVFGVSRRYAIGELFTHAVPQFIPHAERLREAFGNVITIGVAVAEGWQWKQEGCRCSMGRDGQGCPRRLAPQRSAQAQSPESASSALSTKAS